MIKDKKIEQFTQPISSLEDRPQMAASEIKHAFDSNSNELKESLNGVIDEISGSGGSAQIGDDSYGENGNLKATITKVRGEMQGIALGAIPDGTIGSAQLAPDLATAINSVPAKAEGDLSNVSVESFNQKAGEAGITDRLGRLTYNGEDYNAKIAPTHLFMCDCKSSYVGTIVTGLPINENIVLANSSGKISKYIFNPETNKFDVSTLLPIDNGATSFTSGVKANPNGYILIKTTTSNPVASRCGVFDFDLNMLFEVTNTTLINALNSDYLSYDGEYYYTATGSGPYTLKKLDANGATIKSITLPASATFHSATPNYLIAFDGPSVYRINKVTFTLEQTAHSLAYGRPQYATDDFFYIVDNGTKILRKIAFGGDGTTLATYTAGENINSFYIAKNYAGFNFVTNGNVEIVSPDDLRVIERFTIPETYRFISSSYYKIASLNVQNMEYTIIYTDSSNKRIAKGTYKNVITYLEKA